MAATQYRFSVVSKENLRGTSWVIRANEKNSGEVDIYLFAERLGKILKTSFHASGRCHTGFHRPYWNKLKREGLAPSEDRFFEVWEHDVENTRRLAFRASDAFVPKETA